MISAHKAGYCNKGGFDRGNREWRSRCLCYLAMSRHTKHFCIRTTNAGEASFPANTDQGLLFSPFVMNKIIAGSTYPAYNEKNINSKTSDADKVELQSG